MKADQVIALFKYFRNRDVEGFLKIAQQIVASERAHNNLEVARRLELALGPGDVVEFRSFELLPKSMEGMLTHITPKFSMDDLVLSDENQKKLESFFAEQKQFDYLQSLSLAPSKRVMLAGVSGTGKTMTASVIAKELNLPFIRVETHSIIDSHLGESAKNLAKVFKQISQSERAVYFFDEFDTLAGDRLSNNDVAEMRRLVNLLIQFIDRDEGPSILVVATNLLQQIDSALVRRFDIKLEFQPPDLDERTLIAMQLLRKHNFEFDPAWCDHIQSNELSGAQIVDYCKTMMKAKSLRQLTKV